MNVDFGSNLAPPYAREVTDRMARDYAELAARKDEMLAAAAALPAAVEGPEDVAVVSSAVVQLRDYRTRCEAAREAEKQPYLRGGEAVDAFFGALKDAAGTCLKELTDRVNKYKQRQLAEERRRRDEEAAEARRRQEQLRREREELEAAARRARSEAAKAERVAEASYAKVEEQIASARSTDAEIAAAAKPAEMVRERFEGPARSGQVTMQQRQVVLIEQLELLDLERLRTYLREEDLLRALRLWAKATNFREQMPGAVIELRDTAVIK